MGNLRRRLPEILAVGIVALLFGSQWPHAAASVSPERVVPDQVTATPTPTSTSTPTSTPTPTKCASYWTIRVHVFPDDVGGYDPETGEVGCDGNFTDADKMAGAYCKLDNAWVVVYPAARPDEQLASHVLLREGTNLDMWHTFALCVPPPYVAQIMTSNMTCRRLCRHWPAMVELEQSDFDKSIDKRYASVKWPFVRAPRTTPTQVPPRPTRTRMVLPTITIATPHTSTPTVVAPTEPATSTSSPTPLVTPEPPTRTPEPTDTATPFGRSTVFLPFAVDGMLGR